MNKNINLLVDTNLSRLDIHLAKITDHVAATLNCEFQVKLSTENDNVGLFFKTKSGEDTLTYSINIECRNKEEHLQARQDVENFITTIKDFVKDVKELHGADQSFEQSPDDMAMNRLLVDANKVLTDSTDRAILKSARVDRRIKNQLMDAAYDNQREDIKNRLSCIKDDQPAQVNLYYGSKGGSQHEVDVEYKDKAGADVKINFHQKDFRILHERDRMIQSIRYELSEIIANNPGLEFETTELHHNKRPERKDIFRRNKDSGNDIEGPAR